MGAFDPEPFGAALCDGARALGVNVDPTAVERLAEHQRLLAQWNRRVRMVADASPGVTLERHFLDSLALLRPAVLGALEGGAGSRLRLLDAGSGAGFPGLVLAALRPDWEVHLVEPALARAAFLRLAVRALSLGGVTVHGCGLEGVGGIEADVAVARAVFPPARWLRVGAQCIAHDGRLVVMTGRGLDAAAREVARKLGLGEVAVDSFTLPHSGAARVNVVFARERGGKR